MKYRNRKLMIPAIILTALLASIIVPAQEEPKAVLIDEIGPENCEILLGRTDSLAQELNGNPSTTAVIVISPKEGEAKSAEIRRSVIQGNLLTRGIDEHRFRFRLGSYAPALKTQFWLVPDGSTPLIDGKPWPVPPPNVQKPFRFGSADELNICPTFVSKEYADLLRTNPGSRGNIVVYGRDRRSRQDFADSFLSEISKRYQVPRNRFRVFHVYNKHVLYSADFWFVPAKSK